MRAFLFYIDNWKSSRAIQMMDPHEEVGYLWLLMHQAEDETGTLPDDDKQLAVLSKLGRQWFKPTKDADKRIGEMTSGQKIRREFDPHDGRLFNARMYKEWKKQREYDKNVSEVRRENGKLGGRPQTESPRCPCGEMTVARAESRKHKCTSLTKPVTEPRPNLDLTETEASTASASSSGFVSRGSAEGDLFEGRFLDELERCGVTLRQADPDFRDSIVEIARNREPSQAAALFSRLMRQPRLRGKGEGYVIAAFKGEVAV